MTSLHELYLDALVSARPVLGDQVKQIYLHTGSLVECDALIRIYETSSLHGRINIRVRPITHLPAIEAREVLLQVIVSLHLHVNELTEHRGHEELCNTLGCLILGTHDIAERWRKLAIHTRIDELPYYGLEDRPHCKICSGIVATGAGWQPDAVSAPPLAATTPGTIHASIVASGYRADVHHECMRYAINVMLPLLKAQRERAAQKAAKEIDK
jgi:hypothetical protein